MFRIVKLLALPTFENPYHEAWLDLYKAPFDILGAPQDDHVGAFKFRDFAIRKYAWAIPSPEAIACVAKYSPILEVAAGIGYWTRLLILAGADVLAFDDHSWGTNGGGPWTNVVKGSLELVRPNSYRSLFLCWPPYNEPLARHALARYQGGTVIYIGEDCGGCTADDRFHGRLERTWQPIESVTLPQHYGTHDRLTVYRRRRL